MKDYLITYDEYGDYSGYQVYTDKANSLEELFIRFADYCGDNHKTFEKAICAMESIDEYIEVWNRFSSTKICGIYEISNIIYD